MRGDMFFFGVPFKDHALIDENFLCQTTEGHFLTVAPTRSGKGVSLIVPNLLCYRGSALVIDPKGENAWITAPRRRQLGQRIKILDPWNEVNRRYGSKVGVVEEVSRFNPLSALKPGTDDFIENLAYLGDALIINQSTKDPFWDDTARELVSGLMAFVVEHEPYKPHASLRLVRQLLTKSNEELARTIETAIGLGPGSVAANKLGQFKNLEEHTALMSVVAGARTQTAFLDSDLLNQNMDESDFSFDDLRGGGIPTTVYVVIPPDKLGTYARWLRLIVSIAIGTVQRGPLGDEEIESMGLKGYQKGVDAEIERRRREIDDDSNKRAVSNIGFDIGLGPIWPPPGTGPDYSQFELPREAEPTLFDKVVSPITEWRERRREKREKEAHPFKNYWKEHPEQVKPFTIGGMTFDPNAKPPTEEEKAQQKADEVRRDKKDARAAIELKHGRGIPVVFMLDEFGTIGKLAAISKAYGLMAGLGITLWAFVQDLNQLKLFYPEEWETFVSNVKSLTFFRVIDQFTVEYLSKMMGTETIRYYTTTESRSESTRIKEQPGGTGSISDGLGLLLGGKDVPPVPSPEELAGRTSSQNATEHVVAKPLCSPDDIRQMYWKNCLIVGQHLPALCQRVNYFDDKTFSEWARPDPRYAKS